MTISMILTQVLILFSADELNPLDKDAFVCLRIEDSQIIGADGHGELTLVRPAGVPGDEVNCGARSWRCLAAWQCLLPMDQVARIMKQCRASPIPYGPSVRYVSLYVGILCPYGWYFMFASLLLIHHRPSCCNFHHVRNG
jgi:hypothetical protein